MIAPPTPRNARRARSAPFGAGQFANRLPAHPPRAHPAPRPPQTAKKVAEKRGARKKAASKVRARPGRPAV